jgi:hypothetical protein
MVQYPASCRRSGRSVKASGTKRCAREASFAIELYMTPWAGTYNDVNMDTMDGLVQVHATAAFENHRDLSRNVFKAGITGLPFRSASTRS